MAKISNDIGQIGEETTRRYLSGIRVKQSGAGAWKLDVAAGSFIVSNKKTLKGFIRITAGMLHEARRGARGMQGRGDDFRPALAFEIEGEDEPWIAFPMTVVVDILTQNPEVKAHITPSKTAQRLAKIDSRLGG